MVDYSAYHWAKKAEYWAGQASIGQIQSDWNQADNTKKDYIKNKPTKLSDFNNDSGFITSSALSGYATQTWVGQQGFLTSSALTGYATETWVGQQGFLTSSALSGYATETWVGQQGFITSASLPTKLSDLSDDTTTTPIARATADASGNTITTTYATKTELSDKVDLDGSNATFAHIVETYNNGTDWYRIWSDGWCEQGGVYTTMSGSSQTVNLLVEMADTDYIVETVLEQINAYAGSSWAIQDCPNVVQTKTVSSFSRVMPSSASRMAWVIKGMSA